MKARQGVERRQGAQEAVPTRAVAEEDAAAGAQADALEQAKVAGTGCGGVDEDSPGHRASHHSALPAYMLKSTLYSAFI